MRPERGTQGGDDVGKRPVEVAVLPLTETVAGHVDRRTEARVVAIEIDDRAALRGVHERVGERTAKVVETVREGVPIERLDPLVHGCRTLRSRRHGAASISASISRSIRFTSVPPR